MLCQQHREFFRGCSLNTRFEPPAQSLCPAGLAVSQSLPNPTKPLCIPSAVHSRAPTRTSRLGVAHRPHRPFSARRSNISEIDLGSFQQIQKDTDRSPLRSLLPHLCDIGFRAKPVLPVCETCSFLAFGGARAGRQTSVQSAAPVRHRRALTVCTLPRLRSTHRGLGVVTGCISVPQTSPLVMGYDAQSLRHRSSTAREWVILALDARSRRKVEMRNASPSPP